MQLYRGWNSRYAPEHTGRIRLCKATFEFEYRYAFALRSPQWHAFPNCPTVWRKTGHHICVAATPAMASFW